MLLISSDGERFEVDVPVAHMILDQLFEELDVTQSVSLPEIPGTILAKVCAYCKYHADNDLVRGADEIKAWDQEFTDTTTSFDLLLDLLRAANYLKLKPLLHLMCETLGTLINES